MHHFRLPKNENVLLLLVWSFLAFGEHVPEFVLVAKPGLEMKLGDMNDAAVELNEVVDILGDIL